MVPYNLTVEDYRGSALCVGRANALARTTFVARIYKAHRNAFRELGTR
jgi:hypothetical protein